MGDDNWRDRLGKLLSVLGRAWALKSRVALGAAMVSADSNGIPSGGHRGGQGRSCRHHGDRAQQAGNLAASSCW